MLKNFEKNWKPLRIRKKTIKMKLNHCKKKINNKKWIYSVRN